MKRLLMKIVISYSFTGISTISLADGVDIPYFSQIDPNWYSDPMVPSSWKIGEKGCAMTSVAMLPNYYRVNSINVSFSFNDYFINDTNPKDFNSWLSSNGGYDGVGSIYWYKTSGYSNSQAKNISYLNSKKWDSWNGERPDNLISVQEELSQGYPLVIKEGDSYNRWGQTSWFNESQPKYYAAGPLGFPIGVETNATSGCGSTGIYQRFEGGSIQKHPWGTFAVYGRTYQAWGAVGYATWDGFPKSNRYSCAGGELLAAGTSITARWLATDNVGIIAVDVFWGADGGNNWNAVRTSVFRLF